MFFHVWEKWYVQSEATEVCEFRAKIPTLYCILQRRFVRKYRTPALTMKYILYVQD